MYETLKTALLENDLIGQMNSQVPSLAHDAGIHGGGEYAGSIAVYENDIASFLNLSPMSEVSAALSTLYGEGHILYALDDPNWFVLVPAAGRSAQP